MNAKLGRNIWSGAYDKSSLAQDWQRYLKSRNEQRGPSKNDGDAFRHAYLTGNSYRSMLEKNVHELQKPSNYTQVQLSEGFTAERSRSLHVNMEVDTPTNRFPARPSGPHGKRVPFCFLDSLSCGFSAVPPASL